MHITGLSLIRQQHTARRAAVAAAVVFAGLTAAIAGGSGTASAQGGNTGGGGGGVSTPSADLQLTASASIRSPDPGAVFTYSFQIKNSGGSSASSVVFADPTPARTTPNYATLNGSTLPCFNVGDPTGGSTVQCNVGTLAKGASANIVVSVTAPQVAATINNTATVTSATADPNTLNNTAAVSVTVKAPTGGVCKGGICDTVPAPIAAPCATLTAVSAPVGYYSIWAAIWNTYTIQSCSTGSEAVTVQVQETNVATGSVDYDITYPMSLVAGQNSGIVLDNDFAAYSTTYSVTFTVRDSSGTVLSTGSTTATTPGPL